MLGLWPNRGLAGPPSGLLSRRREELERSVARGDDRDMGEASAPGCPSGRGLFEAGYSTPTWRRSRLDLRGREEEREMGRAPSERGAG